MGGCEESCCHLYIKALHRKEKEQQSLQTIQILQIIDSASLLPFDAVVDEIRRPLIDIVPSLLQAPAK